MSDALIGLASWMFSMWLWWAIIGFVAGIIFGGGEGAIIFGLMGPVMLSLVIPGMLVILDFFIVIFYSIATA